MPPWLAKLLDRQTIAGTQFLSTAGVGIAFGLVLAAGALGGAGALLVFPAFVFGAPGIVLAMRNLRLREERQAGVTRTVHRPTLPPREPRVHDASPGVPLDFRAPRPAGLRPANRPPLRPTQPPQRRSPGNSRDGL